MTLKQFTICNYPSANGEKVKEMIVPGGSVVYKEQKEEFNVKSDISREL